MCKPYKDHAAIRRGFQNDRIDRIKGNTGNKTVQLVAMCEEGQALPREGVGFKFCHLYRPWGEAEDTLQKEKGK